MKKPSLSVIMLTLNEEFHIGDAIDNVIDIAQEIFILDSLSSDKTIDIALEKGVTVIQRPFTNFGDQWNFALENFPIKTEWVLKMDPDERLSNEVIESIKSIVNNPHSLDAYEATFRLWFMGKPLHKKLNGIVRLWKFEKCKFSNVAVNEHILVKGKIGKIQGIVEHLDSRDLHHWIEKQNKYTSLLTIQNAEGLKFAVTPKLLGNNVERRMFFMKLFFKLPFRYTFQMLYELFILGAIRDGMVGIEYAKARVMVRKWRELKIKESKITGRLPYIPKLSQQEYNPQILNTELQQSILKI